MQKLYNCFTLRTTLLTVTQLRYSSIDVIMNMSHICKAITKMAKDTAMNIRVSSEDLELIKTTAKANGYDKYSEWCLSVLLQAASKTSVLEDVEELKQRVKKLEQLISA